MDDGLKFKGRWHVIAPKDFLLDGRYSTEARLLWCVLRSYCNHDMQAWPGKTRLQGAMRCSKNTLFKYQRELERAGVLTAQQVKSKAGKYSHTVYTLKEPPCTKNWVTGKSEQKRGESGQNSPCTKKTATAELTPKYSHKDKIKIGVVVDKEPTAIPEALASIPGFKEAWGEWEAQRKESKKPLVDSARKAQWKFLQAQPNPVAVVELSLRNQYQGLFELNGAGNGQRAGARRVITSEDMKLPQISGNQPQWTDG